MLIMSLIFVHTAVETESVRSTYFHRRVYGLSFPAPLGPPSQTGNLQPLLEEIRGETSTTSTCDCGRVSR